MKVTLTMGVCLGKIEDKVVDGETGKTYDVSRQLAIELVECGQAIYAEASAKPTTVQIVTQDPTPQNRDPKLPGK